MKHLRLYVHTLMLPLIFILLLSPLTWAQVSIYSTRAEGINPLGRGLVPLSYGPVRICTATATGSPCTPLAAITDSLGNPISNDIGGAFGQLTTDVTGFFQFGCAVGNYVVQVAASGSNTPQLNYTVTCPYATITAFATSKLCIDARDYGVLAGGTDNSPLVPTLMAAVNTSASAGGMPVCLPGAPGATQYYYYATGMDLTRPNTKIKCSALSGRGPGVVLVLGPGASFTTNASTGANSGFEGCEITSLGYGSAAITAGSASVTSISFPAVGPITAPGCTNLDGAILIGNKLNLTGDMDMVSPSGSYFDTCSGSSGTLHTGLEPAGFSGNATLFRIPAALSSTATVTSGSATVTTLSGSYLWQPGDMVWADPFPFIVPLTSCTTVLGVTTCTATVAHGISTGDHISVLGTSDTNCNAYNLYNTSNFTASVTRLSATQFSYIAPSGTCGNPTGGRVQDLSHIITVWSASGAAGAQTLVLSQTHTGADAAATYSGTARLYPINAAFHMYTDGYFHNNHVYGLPIGIAAVCSSGAGNENCTGHNIADNRTIEQTWMGIFLAGNNTSSISIQRNSFTHNVHDLRNDGTLGNLFVGNQYNSSEVGSNLTVLSNCANQNGSVEVGGYLGQSYTTNQCDRGSQHPGWAFTLGGKPADSDTLLAGGGIASGGFNWRNVTGATFAVNDTVAALGDTAKGVAFQAFRSDLPGSVIRWRFDFNVGNSTCHFYEMNIANAGGGTGTAVPLDNYSTGCPGRTAYNFSVPYFPLGVYRGGTHSCLSVTTSASPGSTAGYEKCDVAWNDFSSDTTTLLWACTADDGANPKHCTSWIARSSTLYSTTSSTVSASIGPTTMLTPAASGYYRFSATARQIGAGASCAGNTTIVLNIIYTDPVASGATTLAGQTFTIVNNGTANVPIGSQTAFPINTKASTAIQYSTTYSAGGSCSPAPTYNLTPILELIN